VVKILKNVLINCTAAMLLSYFAISISKQLTSSVGRQPGYSNKRFPRLSIGRKLKIFGLRLWLFGVTQLHLRICFVRLIYGNTKKP